MPNSIGQPNPPNGKGTFTARISTVSIFGVWRACRVHRRALSLKRQQQKLYWANTLGGLQRSDLNGKNIQNLLTRAGSPRTLAFDGRWVSVDIAEFIDFNQDGRVDQTDYLIVVNAQGEDVKTHPHADLNQDGQIDVDDLLIVIEHFDEPINPAAPALGDPPKHSHEKTTAGNTAYFANTK